MYICPRAQLRNYTSDIHQISEHVTYGRSSVGTLCTSGFMEDVIFAHNGPHHMETCRSITLQRVTSLRRRVHAIAPLLRRTGCVVSQTTAGAIVQRGALQTPAVKHTMHYCLVHSFIVLLFITDLLSYYLLIVLINLIFHHHCGYDDNVIIVVVAWLPLSFFMAVSCFLLQKFLQLE